MGTTAKPAEGIDTARPFRIGEWTVWPDRNEIARAGGSPKRLPRRLVLLPAALAAEPGATRTREALLAAAWSRRVLNDEVLSRSIADLRAALEDDAREPRYVQTVPKVGYRLVAPVAAADLAAAPSPSRGRRALLLAGVLAAAVAVGTLAWRAPRDDRSATILSSANLLRARPLTSAASWEQTPRLSPDGAMLAYSLAEPGSRRAQIWIQSIDGLVRRAVTDDDADGWNLCPVFRPDGRTLVWLHYRGADCTIRMRAIDGGPVRELGRCFAGRPACADVSPDGRLLVFSAPASDDAGVGLALHDFESGATRALTTPTRAQGEDTDARFRPGSDEITFARGTESARNLYRTTRSGATPRRLSGSGDLSFGHAWTADGDAIVFASDALGYRALLRVDASSGAATLLGARGAKNPDVGRDGALVYEVASYDANLWLADLGDAAAPPRRLTSSARYDSQPRLSPDAREVLFQSNREGLDALFVVAREGGPERRLPLDPAPRWSQGRWSADGRAIYATAYEPGGSRIWRLSVEGRAAAPLDAPGREAHAAQESDDGAYLYFLRGHELPRELWRVALGRPDARSERIAEAIDQYRVCGDRLALSRLEQPAVTLCALDGRACRELPVAIARDNRGAWDLAPAHLYFEAPTADGRRRVLHRLALDGGGAIAELAAPAPTAVGAALAVARDESFLVAARNDRYDVDLMYVPPP